MYIYIYGDFPFDAYTVVWGMGLRSPAQPVGVLASAVLALCVLALSCVSGVLTIWREDVLSDMLPASQNKSCDTRFAYVY